MNEEELDYLRELITKPGWEVYLRLIKNHFDSEYSKFRSIKKKTDYQFAHLNGYLDGLDFARKIVHEELENTEPQG